MGNNKEPICTVLLITYNHINYFRNAIESVLCQKTKYPYVIHIFDDASTDGTSDLVREYAEKYPDLITANIADKNQGAPENIWKAYQSVNTRYFTLLECDDYWCDEKKLESQIEALEQHPECSFCAHNTILRTLDETCREYEDESLWVQRMIFHLKNIFYYEDIESIEVGGYIPHISSRIVRTSMVDFSKIRYRESVLFDFNEYFYLLLKGPYYYIDKAMSVYQKTGSGIHSGKPPLQVLNEEYPRIVDFNLETNLVIADKIFREYKLQTEHRLNLYNDYKYGTGYVQQLSEDIANTAQKSQEDSYDECLSNPYVLRSKFERIRCDLEHIKKSKSFKIGRAITFIPRKIRGVLRCFREHGLTYTLECIFYSLQKSFLKTKHEKNQDVHLKLHQKRTALNLESADVIVDLAVLKSKLKRDKYYFLCNAGIGDTLLICALKNALEKKYGAPVHLLISASHEFLMGMYSCSEYTLVDFKNWDLEKLNNENTQPTLGCIFLAHPCAHKELTRFFFPIREQISTVKFYPWFLEFLHLDPNTQMDQPTSFPRMSEAMKNRCEKIAPIDKIVVMCIEATSMLWIPEEFWIGKVKELSRAGYTVISNAKDPQNTIPGTIHLDMALEDAVALSYACHAVYALRSGFCDALFAKGKDLHVFYPRHSSLFIYSLNDLFDRRDIDEQIYLV